MINLFKPILDEEYVRVSLEETIYSGMIGTGPKVEQFRNLLQQKLGRLEVLCTNSCTSAINLALACLKNKISNKTIYTTSLTCFASTSAIINNGFSPAWIDVDNCMCGDLNNLYDSISISSPEIILWTSWGGCIPDLDIVEKINIKYLNILNKKPYWIFDFAHAYGSTLNNRSIPEILEHDENSFFCYSFGAIKTLTCSDGGALICPKSFYEKAERLLWYGISRENKQSFRAWSDITEVGSKWTMNDIAASIGISNLDIANKTIEVSRSNCKYYLNNINNPIIKKLPRYSYEESACWLFTIMVPDRDSFVEYMKENEVECNGIHRPNHTLSCVKQYRKPINLDDLYDKYVCIPCGPHISNLDREYIVKTINEYGIENEF